MNSCSILTLRKSKKEDENTEEPEYLPVKYSYKPSKEKKFVLIHTKLDLVPDWAKQQLHGKAILTLKPYFYPQYQIVLDAKQMDIHQIEATIGKTKNVSFTYTYDSLQLKITLSEFVSKSDTVIVNVHYTAKPNYLATKAGQATTSDKGLYFILPDSTDPDKPTQLWTQSEPESASFWFPTIDAPNQRCTQELAVTYPKRFVSLSNGILVKTEIVNDTLKKDYWRMNLPHAPYLFMLAIGEFTITKDQWRGKEVSYYTEKKYAPYARKIFGRTPEMLEFFSNKLKYPFVWPKYASVVVRDYVSGAMENTSATVFMEDLQKTDRELLDHDWDGIQAHELFHHWFGDLVTCESWANLALNESFANYAEYLWKEHKLGKDAAEYLRNNEIADYLWEAKQKREPIIRYYHKDADDMFDSHSYNKGGAILHMLRLEVGDEAFFESLSRFLEKYAFKSVEIHDLRLVFEEVTGRDLHRFFDEFFLSPGHPEIDVRWKFEHDTLKLFVDQIQDTDYFPLYNMDVKVHIWHNNQKFEHDLLFESHSTTYTIPFGGMPQLVLFDANNKIVGKINEQKKISHYIFQYRFEKDYINREIAMDNLSENPDSAGVEAVLYEALKDPFWHIRELALKGLISCNTCDTNVRNEALKQMALHETAPHVRALVISHLGEKKCSAHKFIFEKGLSDSAWSVVSASLGALLKIEPKAPILQSFENETNGEILEKLSEFFLEQKDTTKAEWYFNSVKKCKGDNLYSFIQNYGKFALHLSGSRLQKALSQLEFLAKNHANMWVRYVATQAIWIHASNPAIKEKLENIKRNEKSERLRSLYEGFN